MKLDILAFGVHPDDVELCCSGTLARHIALGKTAGVIDLTRGELGTRGSAEIRDAEATAAAKALGVQVRETLGMRDGFFQNNEEHQLPIVRMVRKYQPEIVFANAIRDRHPDHGRAAKLVHDACFLAGLVKIETQDNGVKQLPWRPRVIYHYIQDYYTEPDIAVDITDFMEIKMESVRAFSSQFYDPKSNEPETVISKPDFFDVLYARARETGKLIGVKYAEGFTTERKAGVDNLFLLK